MGKAEIEKFLSHLAMEKKVAAATQSQAMNAILFLYKEVLDMPMNHKLAPVKTRKPKKLPTVLTRLEVKRLFTTMDGIHLQMAKLLYGGGLRLLENGHGGVYLPEALARKYRGASKAWVWQYVFPSKKLSLDPRGGETRRHHVNESGLQRAIYGQAKTPVLPRGFPLTHCAIHSPPTFLNPA